MKSITVAKSLLDRCTAHGHQSVTPMQLIKLVYIAHGYMLGKHGTPLLDESVQAWKYGPVVSSVYHAVKGFKDSPVTSLSLPFDAAPNLSQQESEIVDAVAKTYGGYGGIILSSATHRPGTPWYQTWNTVGQNAPISNDLIEGFYAALLKQPKHSAL